MLAASEVILIESRLIDSDGVDVIGVSYGDREIEISVFSFRNREGDLRDIFG